MYTHVGAVFGVHESSCRRHRVRATDRQFHAHAVELAHPHLIYH
jgi:hypothetical protein